MRTFLLILLLCAAGCSLRAQTFDVTANTAPLADLGKAHWRFHPGDDPRWADPAFDDSSWPLLLGNKPWSDQGYPNLTGYGWYRLEVTVPAGVPLTFAPFHIRDGFQLFANGHLAGGFGPMNADAAPLLVRPGWTPVIALPVGDTHLLLAVRVWVWPYVPQGGGFAGTKLLGLSDAVHDRVVAARNASLHQTAIENGADSMLILIGLCSLALFLRDRSAPEFLWFGLWQGNAGGHTLLEQYFVTRLPVPESFFNAFTEASRFIGFVSVILFIFAFIGRPLTRWGKTALAVCVGSLVFGEFQACFLFFSTLVWNIEFTGANVVIYVILGVLLVHFARTSAIARTLLLPLTLFALEDILGGFYFILQQLKLTERDMPLQTFTVGGMLIGADYITSFLMVVIMGWLLMQRFTSAQVAQTRLQGEFAAARTVQQVLIPEHTQELAGLKVHSAYFPASEVGGDFFQLIPLTTPSGDVADGLLVVLGDVSGKGLEAAMKVSLIVGTLRTFAEFYSSPAEILAGLNRRLCGRGDGFTTCIALRIASNGQVTAANAGHLNPYLHGVEQATEPSLPLGLDPDASFTETTFTLRAGDVLTLLTDGVPEATKPQTHELFGFPRTEAVSQQDAEAIAQAARTFGSPAPQADDITVLTVCLA